MNTKKDRVLQKKNNKILYICGGITVIAVAIIGIVVFGNKPKQQTTFAAAPSPRPITSTAAKTGYHRTINAEGGVINFPVSDFADGKARYYRYDGFEKPVFFFLVKAEDDVVRAAFDACDVCYRSKKGYSQNGNVMICNNCGQQFPLHKINEARGGCNPSPIDREFKGNSISISVTALESGLLYF